MEINWFTVIAQIINFLILVWLLKRFLYKPVLNAIDQREKKIAAQLGEAEEKMANARKQGEVFEQKNETFDKERTVKMNEVQEAADTEKQRLFEEVRNQSNVLRSRFEDSLRQQEQDMTDMVKQKTKKEVFAISSKALSDLADADIEEKAVKVFIKKIRVLQEEDKAKLKQTLSSDNKPIKISSAFELSSSSRDELEKTIGKITGQENSFQYQQMPELISGIEINTGSFQLSWNIESYLDDLKMNIISKEKENATL